MSIQEVAEVIGPLVSSFPGVLYGPLFYRQSEHDKTMALTQNKGNYQACIKLSQESVAELQWWCNNIETAEYPICTPKAKIDIILMPQARVGVQSSVGKKQEADGLKLNQKITLSRTHGCIPWFENLLS